MKIAALSQNAAHSLEGVDFFASWKNFHAGGKTFGGEIRIVVHLGNSHDSLPTAAQKNAYLYLKENESVVTDAVLVGLCREIKTPIA